MLESVGQALRAARLKKNLSIEEASRATKIRAARILDLENDEYTRFPNITYARSFLLLYSKFLGVDITKYPIVEAGSTVGLADYAYLQNDEIPTPSPMRQEPQGPPEKPRWLIAFFVLLLMVALGALLGWYVMNFRRLGSMENLVKKETVNIATPTPRPTPTPATAPAPSPAEAATPAPLIPNATSAPSPEAAVPLAASEPSSVGAMPALPPAATPPEPSLAGVEVRPAVPVTTGSSDDAVLAEAAPLPAASPTPAVEGVFPPQGEVREIKVSATKKIKVRIRNNLKDSSLYYGNINPLMAPLPFKGKYFWIKTTDPEALQVTIGGQPAHGPEAGVEITQSSGF